MSSQALGIEHVFVLMMENRSFDHMLGFSGIGGADAVSGQGTQIDGLSGTESNQFDGTTYTVSQGADWVMPADPGHEFPNVLEQLCGTGAQYPKGGAYPPIDGSGFVASYMASGGKAPGEIMKCYAPAQLPVLNALAAEFTVCDNWHASMPGPTWPNRMFVHAASSGGLDHSPSTAEIVEWETLDGFKFPNGNIFAALTRKGIPWRIYGGDDFPMAAALKGIDRNNIRQYSLFRSDLNDAGFAPRYVFIEPKYDVLRDYKAGNSQHPLGDVTQGEQLIKETYESIRNSPLWTSSLLIVTWDEHGGFFDHAIPPSAVDPGDTARDAKYNRYGFTFERYGPRVPAVIVSPLIPKNRIDHRLYDHASIPATVEALFGLEALTVRDAAANRLDKLVTLRAARNDAPVALPPPANSGAGDPAQLSAAATAMTPVTRPNDSVDEGNLPAILDSAMLQDLDASPTGRQAILARVAAIETRADASAYLTDVRQKTRQRRGATAQP
ncbi:MAG: alkaline phosphatase family protein [Bryobacteraceae bacterium]